MAFGLLAGSLLVLVVVPALYAILTDLGGAQLDATARPAHQGA